MIVVFVALHLVLGELGHTLPEGRHGWPTAIAHVGVEALLVMRGQVHHTTPNPAATITVLRIVSDSTLRSDMVIIEKGVGLTCVHAFRQPP